LFSKGFSNFEEILNISNLFFGNDNKLSACGHMIVRIVSALIVLGNRNTSDDFGIVYLLKYLEIPFSNVFKTISDCWIS
jgi:hypothetical protein